MNWNSLGSLLVRLQNGWLAVLKRPAKLTNLTNYTVSVTISDARPTFAREPRVYEMHRGQSYSLDISHDVEVQVIKFECESSPARMHTQIVEAHPHLKTLKIIDGPQHIAVERRAAERKEKL